MKTATTVITATIVPGGFIVLGIAALAYMLARQRAKATPRTALA